MTKLVIVESPYRATDVYTVEQHKLYLLHCLKDSYDRGEYPNCSHHFGPAVLDDNDPLDRAIGMAAGLAWARVADLVAFYVDLGMSQGMEESLVQAKLLGKPWEKRSINFAIVKDIIGMAQ